MGRETLIMVVVMMISPQCSLRGVDALLLAVNLVCMGRAFSTQAHTGPDILRLPFISSSSKHGVLPYRAEFVLVVAYLWGCPLLLMAAERGSEAAKFCLPPPVSSRVSAHVPQI